jgi:hypothetical protein
MECGGRENLLLTHWLRSIGAEDHVTRGGGVLQGHMVVGGEHHDGERGSEADGYRSPLASRYDVARLHAQGRR